MKIIRNLTLTIIGILTIAQSALCQSNNPENISGELKYLKSENGEVFLAIDSTKKITTKGDDGTLHSSKLLQLAIVDPELGKRAMSMIGKQVTSNGSPMACHTQHHHTEVLWLATSLEEPKGEEKSPNQNNPNINNPNLNNSSPNQRSVEW